MNRLQAMNVSAARSAGTAMRAWRVVLLSATLVVGATLALSARAQPGGHHGGMGGPGMMFGSSPERVGRVVDHMLDGLAATDDQRSQIKRIAEAAALDLKAQRAAAAGLHDKAAQVFAAPVVDAAAAEAVRQQMLAQHEQSSRRMLQAMLDVSKVLSPEQRAKLVERMKQRQAQRADRMKRMEGERPPR
jgi:periplasmic protein CpxP/Spy